MLLASSQQRELLFLVSVLPKQARELLLIRAALIYLMNIHVNEKKTEKARCALLNNQQLNRVKNKQTLKIVEMHRAG